MGNLMCHNNMTYKLMMVMNMDLCALHLCILYTLCLLEKEFRLYVKVYKSSGIHSKIISPVESYSGIYHSILYNIPYKAILHKKI